MPWKECDRVSLRVELLTLAAQQELGFSELCRRFGVSRKTGYKWLRRFQQEGVAGLSDRSRRPARSPRRTSERMEALVLSMREQHPAWGGRKIGVRLLVLGYQGVPAASTITAILQRHGRLDPAESLKRGPMQRLERSAPNELWQMDFKGDFAQANRRRWHTGLVPR